METAKSKTSSIPDMKNIPLFFKWSTFSKRVFDIFVSALGLLLLSPVFGLLFYLIKHEGPGPIFYRGPRSGKGGKGFGILKFRTMYENARSYAGPRVTAKDDDRITPLGHWLRDTKINELPQLWNVLIGEMSLVGPRPEDPQIVKTWPVDVQEEILSVRPGITSPASILYRDEEDMLKADGVMDVYLREIVPDKLRLDRLYVRNHSFMGDLDIIFWTAVALIPVMARQQIPEGSLFVGPFYRFTQRYFSWFVSDFLVSLSAVGVVGFAWRAFEPIDWGFIPLAILAFAIAVFFSSVNVLLGLNQVYWSRAGAEDGFLLSISNGFSSVILFLLNSLLARHAWTLPVPSLPHEMIVLIGICILTGSLLTRYRLRLVTSFASRWLSWRGERNGFGERILIFGAGEVGEMAHLLMSHGTFKQVFTVIGIVDDDPSKRGMRINHSWVLGSSSELPYLIRKYDIGVVLFAIANLSHDTHYKLAGICEKHGVRLVYLNDLLGAIQLKLAGSADHR